ncbi:hypothetical protein [Streptomyces sp. JW3]|uniref:hypothetical protein n=1 Tax=Streptomyces sp. JW3 TaxID=3456955 RepID=UPI003FA422EA
MTGTGGRRPAGRMALTVAAVIALVALCTGACGPSDDAEGAGERAAGPPPAAVLAGLREAERATERARSARVKSTTRIGSTISLTAEGALGWTDDRVTGTLTLTYTGGELADSMRQLGSASMEARYLPDAYYARMGDVFAAQAGGRHWVRYGYEDLDDLAGSSGAELGDQIRAATPDRSLDLLLASDDVREVGAERVRGRLTTHYSGTVRDTDAGVTGQTVEVWIDGRDLLVKKVERATTSDGELTQTAHYRDYGVRVSAQRPPADDTRDVTELLDGTGGTGGTGATGGSGGTSGAAETEGESGPPLG